MRVTLSGTVFEITRKAIEKKLRGIEPEEGRAKYFIDIGGKNYPIKQTLSQTLNLPGVAFSSHQAFAILQKLGFKIIEKAN